MIQINYDRERFTSDLQGILDRTQRPEVMLMICGRELANQLKTHFRKKEREEPNKLSPRREHFWLQVARSVNSPVQTGANQVSVTVSDPRYAQKVFGGKIEAKKAGALTIPVEEKAYGRTASTFEQETGLKLFLLKVGGTKTNGLENAVLATKVNGGVQVEYVLTRSVNQKADPTAVPPQEQMEKAILERAQSVLERQLNDEK